MASRWGNGNGEWIIDGKPYKEHCTSWEQTPRFSRDIAAAMQVVEKMRADKWDIQITSDDESPAWHVSFDARGAGGELILGEYESDSLPEAICRAVREAMKSTAKELERLEN